MTKKLTANDLPEYAYVDATIRVKIPQAWKEKVIAEHPNDETSAYEQLTDDVIEGIDILIPYFEGCEVIELYLQEGKEK